MSAPAREPAVYGHPLYSNRQAENRLSIDPVTGHFCLVGPATDAELPFLDAIASLRTLYPLDDADIVLDAGWTRDPETGHVVPEGWDGTQTMRERAFGDA